MKKAFQTLLACGLLSITPLAHAETVSESNSNFFGSIGYGAYDADGENLGAIIGRGTVFFKKNFGVEAEASFGVSDSEETTIVQGIQVQATYGLGTSFGLYGVGKYDVAENFELFGRLGYATTEVEASLDAGSFGGASSSTSVGGVGLGVGANYYFSEKFGLRADFTTVSVDENDVEGTLDILSVGLSVKF